MWFIKVRDDLEFRRFTESIKIRSSIAEDRRLFPLVSPSWLCPRMPWSSGRPPQPGVPAGRPILCISATLRVHVIVVEFRRPV
jgi:hypothetical protein